MTAAPPSLLSAESIETMLGLARSTPPGCFVEVGVYKGGSAWHLAKLAREQHRALHLFDTFTGIPEKSSHDHHNIGDFGDTSFEAVRAAIPDALFHVGVFPALNWLALKDEIAFIHIDCDQHDSILSVIYHFAQLMVKDGIMLFDDFNALDGATRAVKTAFSAADIQVTPQGKAFVVFNQL